MNLAGIAGTPSTRARLAAAGPTARPGGARSKELSTAGRLLPGHRDATGQGELFGQSVSNLLLDFGFVIGVGGVILVVHRIGSLSNGRAGKEPDHNEESNSGEASHGD